MIIREFERGDKQGVLEILKETWSISKIDDSVLDEWMNNNYNFVAVDNDEILGVLTLHTQRKLIRDGGIAGFIEDVAVKEKYRGKNIGSMLVQEAVEKAKKLGCYKVILSCFSDKIKFYERNGFREELITMRFSIENIKIS
jgi:GNAT superfamily N-acetyltransferase